MPNRGAGETRGCYCRGMAKAEPIASRPESSELPDSTDGDRDQIAERLCWTPKQRLEYLTDMVAFEERARRARRLG